MGKVIPIKSFSTFLEDKHFPLWLALNHHKTHTNKKMTLKGHYYLKEILMDKSRHRVLKKSTQGGVSETLIIIAWSFAKSGRVVFYTLPTDGLKGRFVTNRFEKSLAFSKYYREQRSSEKSKEFRKEIIDNQSLKDIGEGVVNFAGSMSDVPFIEIPADIFIVDEADLCDPNRLEMGKERLGHSDDPHEIYVGNPTFIGSFLDLKYSESTMSRWHIKHNCGHYIKYDFFNHVVQQIDEHDYIVRDKEFEFNSGNDIRPICDKCHGPFDRFAKGHYVDFKKSEISGKHISRVFSGASPLTKIVDNFSKALENDYKMQRFYNSDLGESFTASGSKISIELINKNTGDYLMPSSSKGPCIMGVDVGNVHHVRINRILPDNRKQAVFIGVVHSLAQIYSLFGIYNVVAAVIDALPEISMSKKFSHSERGNFRCFFGGDKADSVNLKEKSLTVSRLSSIDNMKEAIVKQQLLFPKNIISIEEYMDHIQAPTRVWDEEKEKYSWVSIKADHFFFAEVYCSLAEKMMKFLT